MVPSVLSNSIGKCYSRHASWRGGMDISNYKNSGGEGGITCIHTRYHMHVRCGSHAFTLGITCMCTGNHMHVRWDHMFTGLFIGSHRLLSGYEYRYLCISASHWWGAGILAADSCLWYHATWILQHEGGGSSDRPRYIECVAPRPLT